MRLQGWVDRDLCPHIRVQTPAGRSLDLVVDTGFNGELVLPLGLLRQLHFRSLGWTLVELADGSNVATPLYEGRILWFSEPKRVKIHATRSRDALLGTRMLVGYRLKVDIEEGRVVIEQKRRQLRRSA